MNQVSESSGRWAGPRRGLLGTVATAAMVAGSLVVAQPAWAAGPLTNLNATSTPLPAGRGLTVAWTPTPAAPDLVLSYLAEADGPDAGTGADASCTVDTDAAGNCNITGLLAGVPYTVNVTARSATGGLGGVIGSGPKVIAPGASTTPKLPTPAVPTAIATGVSGEVEVTADNATPAAGPDIASFTSTAYLGGVSTGKSCTTTSGIVFKCKITGLANGTEYTVKTVANSVGANGNSAASVATAPVKPLAAPQPPSGLMAKVIDDDSVSLSWTASPTEDVMYVVKPFFAASGATATATGCGDGTPLSDTTCTVTGLDPNVGYNFQVVAQANGFNSVPTAKSATVTPTPAPDKPASANAVAGDASATVTWTLPMDLTVPVASYIVTALDNGVATEHTCTATDELTCEITGLTNGTAYTFEVRSVGLTGALSAATTDGPETPVEAPKPVAPEGVTLTATDTTIKVMWDAPAANPTVPVVHFVATASSGDASDDMSCATANSTTYTCTIAGLEPETEYTVTVVARGADSTSLASDEETVTTLAAEVPGGPGTDNPSGPIVVNPEGRQQIFTRGGGPTALLWTASRNPNTGKWEDWTSMGGPLYSDPVPVMTANGHLQVFVLDVNGFVTYKLQGNDGKFGEWKRVSMDRSIAKIVAAKNANGTVQIFGRSGMNLYTAVQGSVGDTWSAWVDLGYPVSGDPTVAAMADGSLEVFTSGYQGAIYRRAQTAPNATTWTSWERVAPAAAASEFV